MVKLRQSAKFLGLDVGRWTLDLFRLQTKLAQFIRGEIEKRGPQSFAWFMEQALYHPEHGYYSTGRAAIGRRGDYFTNVSVGSLFGGLLAVQFAQIWEQLDKIDNFIIVEQGAHHGEFARDVLEFAQRRFSKFFAALRYQIVEPFAALQDRQSQTLQQFGDRVCWRASLEEMEPFIGIHFSNELLDSLPVHQVVSTDSGWQEKCVALNGDEFVFVDRAITDPKLQAIVKNLPSQEIGYETEFNLTALNWIDTLSKKLQRGFVITVDYGFSRQDFYAPHRGSGTLQVRARHRHLGTLFEQIGRVDISAHVEWTSLVERAQQRGLNIAGFIDQHHFLTGIISDSQALFEKADARIKRELQTLLHPEMLGRAFQVLVLTKDVDLSAALSGLKFSRNAREALGL